MDFILLIQLAFRRYSTDLKANAWIKVLTAISTAYFLFMLIFAANIIAPVITFEKILFAVVGYLMVDLVARILFQKFSANALDFTFLPVSTSVLVHFVLVRNSINPYSAASVSFLCALLRHKYNELFPFLMITFAVLAMNWLVMFVKLTDRVAVKAFLIAIIVSSFSSILIWGEDTLRLILMSDQMFAIIASVILLTLIYVSVFLFVKRNIKAWRNEKPRLSKVLLWESSLDHLLVLDIKLIVRNKRVLTYVIGAPLIIFAFLYIVGFQGNNIPVVGAVFFSAVAVVLPIFFSQYLYAWESEHFGFILASMPTHHYITSKHKLVTILTLINGVCLTPLFFTADFNYYFLAIWLFHVGVTPSVVLAISLNNDQRLALSRSAFLNYEGTTANTFLLILLAPLIPIAFYLPFYFINEQIIGMYVLSVIGVAGLFTRSLQIKNVAKAFLRKKYSMYRGFKFNQ